MLKTIRSIIFKPVISTSAKSLSKLQLLKLLFRRPKIARTIKLYLYVSTFIYLITFSFTSVALVLKYYLYLHGGSYFLDWIPFSLEDILGVLSRLCSIIVFWSGLYIFNHWDSLIELWNTSLGSNPGVIQTITVMVVTVWDITSLSTKETLYAIIHDPMSLTKVGLFAEVQLAWTNINILVMTLIGKLTHFSDLTYWQSFLVYLDTAWGYIYSSGIILGQLVKGLAYWYLKLLSSGVLTADPPVFHHYVDPVAKGAAYGLTSWILLLLIRWLFGI